MRYLILCISLVFTSCGPEAVKFKRSFVIKNGLETAIKVNFLLNEDLVDSSLLSSNQRIVGNEFESTVRPEDIPNNSGPSTSFNAIIIEVIYNNERKSVSTFSDIDNGLGFFSEPVERNLLRTGNYESIGNDEYLFTITQQDFDNATPCDGPCE